MGPQNNPRRTITFWTCSDRCWQEGGPHDEHCRPTHFDQRPDDGQTDGFGGPTDDGLGYA